MKNIYFFSDIHLGLPNHQKSLVREKRLVKALDEIKESASEIFFVGDIFDYWWEYKYVVPRGYTRFLGKISEMSDAGIKIHFFTGNHDVWIKSYVEEECGAIVHTKEYITEIYGNRFFIAHGDGLGPGDKGYKFLKKIFLSKFLQWCWSRLHPNFTFSIARLWSDSRRKREKEYTFRGFDKEFLILFAKEMNKKERFDYFIFGHRHFPLQISLDDTTQFVNLGDWIVNFTFGELSSKGFRLKTFKSGIIEDYITDLEKIEQVNIY